MIGLKAITKCLMSLLLCTAVLMASGCRFPWLSQTVTPDTLPSPQLMKVFQQAVAAYQTKEYGVAAKRFKAVQEKSTHSGIASSASYGLACARLMAAKTPGQYREAVALWEAWVAKASTDFEKANPVLMVPLVKEKMLFSNIPLTPDGRGDIAASPEVSQWLLINASKEIKRLKAKLESDDRSKKKYKDRIVSLEKEMAKLRKQIKALETIDQKIQEKKHAIPSTDSSGSR